ncbi:hypothetical protein, partial [Burkholderia gladioli]|uniref:hypothetical protein n=1 Tax=Burkholderia gladioli TaxID=28095 RepID=UPI003F7A32D9
SHRSRSRLPGCSEPAAAAARGLILLSPSFCSIPENENQSNPAFALSNQILGEMIAIRNASAQLTESFLITQSEPVIWPRLFP